MSIPFALLVGSKAGLIVAFCLIKGVVCQFPELLGCFAARFGSDRNRIKRGGGLFGLFVERLKFF